MTGAEHGKRDTCPDCAEPLDTTGDTYCDRCGWTDPDAPLGGAA